MESLEKAFHLHLLTDNCEDADMMITYYDYMMMALPVNHFNEVSLLTDAHSTVDIMKWDDG